MLWFKKQKHAFVEPDYVLFKTGVGVVIEGQSPAGFTSEQEQKPVVRVTETGQELVLFPPGQPEV